MLWKTPYFRLALLTAALGLTGCALDEDKDTPTTYTGTVADGPLQGAIVFLDQDGDFMRDAGEPSTLTDAQGRYRLEAWGLDTQQQASLSIVAEVPATAIDADTGQAVGQPYILSAPAREHSFISPISTLSHLVALLYPQLPGEARREMVSDFLFTGQPGETVFSADSLAHSYLIPAPSPEAQVENERLHAKARLVAVMLQRALAGAKGERHQRLQALADYAFALPSLNHQDIWGMTSDASTPDIAKTSISPERLAHLERFNDSWHPVSAPGLPRAGSLNAVTTQTNSVVSLQLSALGPCGHLQTTATQRDLNSTWQTATTAEEVWLARTSTGDWQPLYGSEFQPLSSAPGRSRCRYDKNGIQLDVDYQALEHDLGGQLIAQTRTDWIGTNALASAAFSPQARAVRLREMRTTSNLAPGALMALPTQRAVPNLTVDELLRGCPTNASRCNALFFDSLFEPGLLFGNITSTQQTLTTGRISYKSFFFKRDCQWQQGADTRSEWLTLSDCHDSWALGFFFRLPSSDGAAFLIESPNTATALIRVGTRHTRLPRARELRTTYYNAAALTDLNAALPGGEPALPVPVLWH